MVWDITFRGDHQLADIQVLKQNEFVQRSYSTKWQSYQVHDVVIMQQFNSLYSA